MLKYTCINKSFNNRKIVDNFNLKLERGERIYLKGESGKGKTTILNILSGMLKPDSGQMRINPNNFRGTLIAYEPCGDTLLESLTARENIILACAHNSTDRKDKIKFWSEMLKVDGILDSYPRELSSGEYKRICLVRAFVQNTPYVFLDEPTSNLDKESAELVIKALTTNFQDVGMIIATHDQNLLKTAKPEEVIEV